MNLAAVGTVLIVSLVAGFVYNWLTPRLQPMLPVSVTQHAILRTLATGVFILLAITVAHFVSRHTVGREGPG